MNIKDDIDTGIIGWYERHKTPMIVLLSGYVLVTCFILGYREGAAETRKQFDARLAEHRMLVLTEAVTTVNKISKNRAKYECLKFKASHLGVGLEF